MRKITFLAAMFCLFGFSNVTNAQWNNLTSGTTSFLNSVYFTDANTGYVVGDGGTILKTSNSGTNWNSKTSGTTNTLHSVYFTDANSGYSVGDGGIILKTSNSGTYWTAQTVTVYSLYSVYFTDANTGFAVGMNGLIFKTSNGGTNWTAQTNLTNYDLNSVYFTDANTGYAVGESGMIYKTINSGNNWMAQTSGTTYTLMSVYFTDANTGYAVGGEGTILKTSNGGTNWTALTSGTTSYLTTVYFTDANTGYAVGDKIFKTSNGGTNWIEQTGTFIFSVYFTDANTGYAVGGLGTILKTTNGGSAITLPSAPTNLTLSSQKNILSKMILSWTDNSNNEDGFRIYRSTDDANFIEIGTTVANINTYIDSTGAASTLYYYRVTAYNSAGSSTFSNTTSGTTSDINEVSENNAISLYPNPTIGKLAVSLSSGNIGTIEIYNLTGEKVYEKNFNQQKSTEINLSNSISGIYFLKISNGTQVYTRKIVVQ